MKRLLIAAAGIVAVAVAGLAILAFIAMFTMTSSSYEIGLEQANPGESYADFQRRTGRRHFDWKLEEVTDDAMTLVSTNPVEPYQSFVISEMSVDLVIATKRSGEVEFDKTELTGGGDGFTLLIYGTNLNEFDHLEFSTRSHWRSKSFWKNSASYTSWESYFDLKSLEETDGPELTPYRPAETELEPW
ncbi:MAG: hypothetical protein CMJ46_13545 [Planctomyces sp.]|nr:hypothetical protein [Planctomyces sp.]